MSTYLGTTFIAGMSPDMTGATASTDGTHGLVPAPAAGAPTADARMSKLNALCGISNKADDGLGDLIRMPKVGAQDVVERG